MYANGGSKLLRHLCYINGVLQFNCKFPVPGSGWWAVGLGYKCGRVLATLKASEGKPEDGK